MHEITELMTADHRSCDDQMLAVEQAVNSGDWEAARSNFGRFQKTTIAHFAAEETLLFPLFEQRTGMYRGPTQVMRGEHLQIRQLLTTAEAALDAADSDEYLGSAETLLIMIQQHNVKEENILYPMCDQHLADQIETLLPMLRHQLGEKDKVAE